MSSRSSNYHSTKTVVVVLFLLCCASSAFQSHCRIRKASVRRQGQQSSTERRTKSTTTTTRSFYKRGKQKNGHCHHPASLSSLLPLFGSVDDSDHETSMIRVGIAGAGAVAFGTAAVLAETGHLPMIWSPSGKGTSELISNTDSDEEEESKAQSGTVVTSTGALESEFEPLVAKTAKQLVDENEVVIIALPANGHKRIFDEISSSIRSHQNIIISSHSSFGALYLSKRLDERLNINSNKGRKSSFSPLTSLPAITAWGTTICTARRKGTEPSVQINTVRQSVDLCTVPFKKSKMALSMCQRLFPSVQFIEREGLLAVTLSNLNPQNHLGIAMGNMARMEKHEQWYQSLNITPNIGRLLEALDQERLVIAEALGIVGLKTVCEHFSWSFHVPMSDSISDMNQEINTVGNDVLGPNTADSRYVLEDVPFGLASTIILGSMVGKPAVLHMAGMQIMSAMYGRDFMQENDILDALHLEQYTLGELTEASYSGYLRKQKKKVPAQLSS